MTASCPSCGRPNGPHRSACMYCGSPLPTRSPQEREGSTGSGAGASQASDQLDSLVRQALSGQRAAVQQLKATLGEQAEGARLKPGAGLKPGSAGIRTEPSPAQAPGPSLPMMAIQGEEGHRPAPAKEGAPRSQDALDASRGPRTYMASEPLAPAGRVLVTPAPLPPSDPRSMRVRVQDEPTSTRSNPPTMPSAETGQLFPSFRQGFGLVIDAPGDADLAPELGAALHLDVATARLHASARGPRLVLRHPQREALEARAAAVRDRLHIPARTVGRELLLSLPSALCLVEAHGWRLRVTTDPLWHMAEDAPARESTTRWVEVQQVQLVIPGQVGIRRYREQTISRRLTRFGEEGMRGGSTQERIVVDLVLINETQQQLSVRLVEGVTDVRGLPGYVEGSTLRSVRAWLEQLGARWPEARVLARFSARVPDNPVHRGEGEEVLVTGWPAWEEHSSLCRLMMP